MGILTKEELKTIVRSIRNENYYEDSYVGTSVSEYIFVSGIGSVKYISIDSADPSSMVFLYKFESFDFSRSAHILVEFAADDYDPTNMINFYGEVTPKIISTIRWDGGMTNEEID